ncbi:MAG: glycosyltransferase family 4 protein [Flavobacteriaceae bacterium]|nr:glycosyltransferase family 4 protein [Flavobacteriaceae bacterium]NNK60005.1 glycosyltransferase family 4 protein [Flavobacteriaceae bacterium]
MKNVLYIGNNLKTKSSNVSSIQVLGGFLEQEGFRMYYASSKANKLLRLFDMVLALIRYKKRIDYIIIDTYSTHNFYFALIISQICRLFKLRYIPNLNGGNLPARLTGNPKLSSLIFRNAYINVSPSYYLKDAFYQHGHKNVKYIPNSIKINNYKYKERSYDQIKLLWVRSFSQIYNPELAVRVQRKLIDLGFQTDLCMVGPDSDGSLNRVKSLAKKLKVDTIFTGKLTKKEWIALSEDYNIFINSTNFDNAPVSVIEAMALGLPIVSTNVGGLPYLIIDHVEGVLVEPNNLDGMVQAIINIVFDHKFTQTITSNARKKVEQFDWQVVKHAWFEVLV